MGAKIAIFRLRRFWKDRYGDGRESPSGCAPGYRDAGNEGCFGALVTTGTVGSVWSASTDSEGGIYLDFNMNYFYSGRAHNRAYGFQLRCLSE